MRREPSLTFRGALRILGKTETPLIDQIDTLVGGVILAAGAGAGIAAAGGPAALGVLAPIWQWVDQKNEAGGLLRKLLGRVPAKINNASGLDRRQLIAAAHSTIVIAAYFDIFHEAIAEAGYNGLELRSKEKARAAFGLAPAQASSLIELLYSSDIPAPSATRGFLENRDRVARWIGRLHDSTTDLVESLALEEVLREIDPYLRVVPRRAADRYRAYYVDLAAAVPEFKIWTDLDEHAATRTAVDTSFQEVRVLLAALGANAARTPAAARALDLANTGRLRDPVVSTSIPWPDARFRFPNVGQLFVPPGFRICVFDSSTRASDDDWWAGQPLRHRLAERLAAHLLSTDATQTPLLLLGHPGAGKSMLMKMLAATLPPEEYATVNIPLRAVSAHASILDQIQDGLDLATHRRVSWAGLADETADRMRVVLLDGLDELLLAANLDRTGYLQEIIRFQQVEADQDRPVAVIVTSRTIVADRIDVPVGTPVVKLAGFDDDQIGQWITRWNEATPTLAATPGTRRLSAAEALRAPHLAQQPLLLMLLALYASGPGAAQLDAASSQATLYNQLFTRFAGRETTKDLRRTLLREEARAAVEVSIDRLCAAALAMFNRGRQHIGATELGNDLRALAAGQDDSRSEESGERLLMEFFFIHVNEATMVGGAPVERSYEFLHATFGEYLVARKIIEVVRDMADAAYNGRRHRDPSDDLLHALISHQALATQPPILQFANQIFHALPELERAQIIEVLEFLIARWRVRPASERYRDYRPMPVDHLRQPAAYSANLIALRLYLTPSGRLTRSPQLTRDWPALVALWNSGLDLDAWLATLRAMTLDRRDGTITTEPPGHGHSFPEYDSARLIGNNRVAGQLGLGAAVLNGVRNIFSPDDWRLMMQSWLIPAITTGDWGQMALAEPPPRATEHDRAEIAHLLATLLRTRIASLESSVITKVVGLLLTLDARPDPIALTVALCAHPKLLTRVPALGQAELYRGNPATALMMHGLESQVGPGELRQWQNLGRAIGSAAGFRPDREGISSPATEMLLRQFFFRDGVDHIGRPPSAEPRDTPPME
ncbi:NACHT domain-containing protein [Actinoplanes sp. HUAS TT8]|uniref:NACHT domain-containing protein n=1 Tax=Actinoplanes sp. HUAS TT8 TaxID=3447453 RepID=UPI003F528721